MAHQPLKHVRIFTVAALLVTATANKTFTDPLPASLIADSISYSAETETLTASGNVEVLYEGRILRARELIYDARAEEIRALGPLVLADPDSGIVLAESATIDPSLQDGLVRGAQLLVADQLQIAAGEVRRADGRFTTLDRAVASACTICPGNPTPTWAIRAARVTQDDAGQRVYFENARLEAFGLPIAYVPRISIPDPSVERANGFLIPSLQQSDIYGLGAKVPYYFVLSPSADATLTPFATTTGALLFEGEYRRRFQSGGFDLEGVVAASDGLGGDPGRGAFSALGLFNLRNGFQAEFDVNITSDKNFLQQFDYSDDDRLTSIARVFRTTTNEYASLGTSAFQSLREGEDTATIPFILPDFTYTHLSREPIVGGDFSVNAQTLGVLRENGNRMFRAGGAINWRKDWVLPFGFTSNAVFDTTASLYEAQGYTDAANGFLARADPSIGAELRWPLARNESGGAVHVIEPIAQVYYTEALGEDDNPNEDSQLPELDDTNLFALNRFPGVDRSEVGLRANIGLRYNRIDPNGWNLGFTIGRIIRAETDEDFSAGSGLAGHRSDLVSSLSLDFDWGLTLVNRALFGTDLAFKRNEFGVAYDSERLGFTTTYVFLAEDDSNPILGPQPETNEFGTDARYRFHPNWEVRGEWRYDALSNRNLRAGGGLTYGNSCAEIDFKVTRRYTSSSGVPPSTSFGLNVRLAGLGDAGEYDWPPEICLPQRT